MPGHHPYQSRISRKKKKNEAQPSSLPPKKRQCKCPEIAHVPLHTSSTQLLQSHMIFPHKVVTPGVHASPILFMASPNFLLVILLPPLPPSGACSSGS